VEAEFTNGNHTISATLYFNGEGAITDFVSRDRFMSSDGITYLNYPWSTPVTAWKETGGRKVPSLGEAIWQMPEGRFSYGQFDINEIEYNLVEFK
jgi:hypothetical protein